MEGYPISEKTYSDNLELLITQFQDSNNLKGIILLSAGITLSSLILSYLLIPHFGIMGPGIGWLVSNILAMCAVLPIIIKLIRSDISNSTEPNL